MGALLSEAATEGIGDDEEKVIELDDVSRAFFEADVKRDVCIELPEECGAPPGMCGKLNFWLHGFREAASACEQHYSGKFEEVGFERGNACGVVFYHLVRDLSLAVHGDDSNFCGYEEDLHWIKDLITSWFEIKVRGIFGSRRKG